MSAPQYKRRSIPLATVYFAQLIFLLVTTILALVIAWKIYRSEVDLTGTILALFSVGLSVAFYFKANETSNQFYDNTYKFTNNMSELLGRIDSGFGERLRHLDEGNNHIREKLNEFSDLYRGGPTLGQEKNQEVRVQRSFDELRDYLAKFESVSGQIPSRDTAELVSRVTTLVERIANERLDKYKGLANEQFDTEQLHRRPVPLPSLLKYVTNLMRRNLVQIGGRIPVSHDSIDELFALIKDDLAISSIYDMQYFDLLDQDLNLTQEGMDRLVTYLNSSLL